jgi:hypothetical protein
MEVGVRLQGNTAASGEAARIAAGPQLRKPFRGVRTIRKIPSGRFPACPGAAIRRARCIRTRWRSGRADPRPGRRPGARRTLPECGSVAPADRFLPSSRGQRFPPAFPPAPATLPAATTTWYPSDALATPGRGSRGSVRSRRAIPKLRNPRGDGKVSALLHHSPGRCCIPGDLANVRRGCGSSRCIPSRSLDKGPCDMRYSTEEYVLVSTLSYGKEEVMPTMSIYGSLRAAASLLCE